MRLARGRDKKIQAEKWAQEKTDESREDLKCPLLLIKLRLECNSQGKTGNKSWRPGSGHTGFSGLPGTSLLPCR